MKAWRPTQLLTVLAGVGIMLAPLYGCTQSPNTTAQAPGATETTPAATTPDVPYVPTPQEVVDEMLRLGQVGPNDVLYDLGSGDGRIVITAAQKYNVSRATGIEINPDLVQRSRDNAQQAGVSDRVEFRQQDLFETDLRDATVVTLYLLPAVNLRLKPKLLSELRPGSRVVSHAFDMGDWEPEETVQVQHNGRTYTLYAWTIPAQVSGQWQGTVSSPRGGEQAYTVQLDQEFQELSGTFNLDGQNFTIDGATIQGDRIQFNSTENLQGQNVALNFDGRVAGNTLTGTATVQGGPAPGQYEFRAQRQ